MKWLKRVAIGLGSIGFAVCACAVLLFNRPAFGWQLLSVPTGSMRPTFTPGSLVLVHRVPASSLRVGDVITYTNPLTMRSTLTHRIVKAYKLGGKVPAFITKGDANPSPDPPVVAGLVQGRMVGHIPFAGRAFMWAKTWTGIAVLIYAPALLIMTEETRRLAMYLRQIKLYRLEGWRPRRSEQKLRPAPAVAASALLAIALTGVGWQTAFAVSGPLQSNTAVLTPNVLTAAKALPPPTNTNCTSTTNVTVNNSSDQTATSGSATASGGGSAVSGSASNTSNSNISVTVHGC